MADTCASSRMSVGMFERAVLVGWVVVSAASVAGDRTIGVSGNLVAGPPPPPEERNDDHDDSATRRGSLHHRREGGHDRGHDRRGHRRGLKSIRIGTQEYENRATLVYAGGRCQTRNQSPQKQAFTARLVEAYRNNVNANAAGRRNNGREEDDGAAEGGRGGGRRRRGGVFEPVTVPTYVHVVRRDDAADAPAAADRDRILEQMSVLNAAFSGRGFSFALADLTRARNTSWYYAPQDSIHEADMKRRLRRGSAAALNVYVTNAGNGVLGWSTFPTDYETDPALDGVVVLDQSLPGGTASPYNEGVTLVHQVGHWLGLYHTFQGLGCYGSGDYVRDTAPVLRPNVGCPKFRDSCMFGNGTTDPVHNYMDYTDDGCMDSFTRGQVERMEALWMAYRQDDYERDADVAVPFARDRDDDVEDADHRAHLVLAFAFFLVIVLAFVGRLSGHRKGWS